MADRGNRRIQVFDGDGKFLRQITIDVPFDETHVQQSAPSPRSSLRQRQPCQPGPPGRYASPRDRTRFSVQLRRLPRPNLQANLDGKVLGYWENPANS